MRIALCLAFTASCLAPLASAQLAVTFSDFNDMATITVSPRPGIPLVALTGAPYYGLQTIEQLVTVPDGTHLSKKVSSTKYWRDSEGRLRRDQEFLSHDPQLPPAHLVDIFDPITGFDYVIDDRAGVVHRIKVQARQHRNPAMNFELPPMPPKVETRPDGTIFKVEFLPSRIIAGLRADGVRSTTQHPPGSKMGNDRSIETSSEVWSSRELGTSLLTKTTDPRGDSVIELHDVVRGEPDPALMQPPPGYRVLDEEGPFEVVIRKK